MKPHTVTEEQCAYVAIKARMLPSLGPTHPIHNMSDAEAAEMAARWIQHEHLSETERETLVRAFHWAGEEL